MGCAFVTKRRTQKGFFAGQERGKQERERERRAKERKKGRVEGERIRE